MPHYTIKVGLDIETTYTKSEVENIVRDTLGRLFWDVSGVTVSILRRDIDVFPTRTTENKQD